MNARKFDPMASHLTDDLAQRLADLEAGALVGELDPALEGARAHRDACPACAAIVDAYAALADALADLDAPPPPPDFTANVMALIDVRETERRFARRVALGIALGSAVLAAVALTVAGGIAWTPALAATGAQLGRLLQALSLAESVLRPVVAALRVQLALWCVVAAAPLLFAIRRLALARQIAQ